MEMIRDVKQLFAELIKAAELRKIDFKSDQYRLDGESLKSKFVKDILCMANAAGDDGYVLLGVRSEKGKPQKVVGIPYHHDSSDLEAIVNGVIDEPIQFEYYPLNYRGKECALLHIPPSKAKPHWPRKDYGVLRKHVIYSRRSSGNREASIQEVREMCIETIRISDIAHRKVKSSPHVIDELADMSLDEREVAMHKMLKSIAPKLGLARYRYIYSLIASRHFCTLVTSKNNEIVLDYAIFVYPWTTRSQDIVAARYNATSLIASTGSRQMKKSTRNRLKESSLIHVSYKNIHTNALESRPYCSTGYWFANEWSEPWGRVMKWEDTVPHLNGNKMAYLKKARYEFFLPNVTSKAEFKDRLEKLLAWIDANIT